MATYRSAVMAESITIGVSIPKNLLVKVDQDRCDVSRSRFLQRLVEQAYAQKQKEGAATGNV